MSLRVVTESGAGGGDNRGTTPRAAAESDAVVDVDGENSSNAAGESTGLLKVDLLAQQLDTLAGLVYPNSSIRCARRSSVCVVKAD